MHKKICLVAKLKKILSQNATFKNDASVSFVQPDPVGARTQPLSLYERFNKFVLNDKYAVLTRFVIPRLKCPTLLFFHYSFVLALDVPNLSYSTLQIS